jgi:hypothetical protein
METGLSSNATRSVPGFRYGTAAAGLFFIELVIGAPVAAQDDSAATPAPVAAEAESPPTPTATEAPPRINLLVTRPRSEANQAQAKQCEERADAGTLSGEIVVCRDLGDDGTGLTGSRAESQKRYAEETALKGAPRAPDFIADCKDQGNPFGCVGFGKVPPPAYIVDFNALPTAPAGSDADRIAQGLPPLNEDRELTEEEEKARREALGIKTTVPPRPKKKGG